MSGVVGSKSSELGDVSGLSGWINGHWVVSRISQANLRHREGGADKRQKVSTHHAFSIKRIPSFLHSSSRYNSSQRSVLLWLLTDYSSEAIPTPSILLIFTIPIIHSRYVLLNHTQRFRRPRICRIDSSGRKEVDHPSMKRDHHAPGKGGTSGEVPDQVSPD